MEAQYHYQLADQVYGPVTFEELVVRVRKGILTPGTLVNSQSQNEWIYAATVEHLFEQAGQGELLEQWTAEQSDILRMKPLSPEELLQKREREALEEQREKERMDIGCCSGTHSRKVSSATPRADSTFLRNFVFSVTVGKLSRAFPDSSNVREKPIGSQFLKELACFYFVKNLCICCAASFYLCLLELQKQLARTLF